MHLATIRLLMMQANRPAAALRLAHEDVETIRNRSSGACKRGPRQR
jgi:hypothetical protein